MRTYFPAVRSVTFAAPGGQVVMPDGDNRFFPRIE